jgi:hypothetical protein
MPYRKSLQPPAVELLSTRKLQVTIVTVSGRIVVLKGLPRRDYRTQHAHATESCCGTAEDQRVERQ